MHKHDPERFHESTPLSTGSAGAIERVCFVGGFVGAAENELARRMIAESMANVGGRALFCRHAEFLGALGSLDDCLQRHADSPSR